MNRLPRRGADWRAAWLCAALAVLLAGCGASSAASGVSSAASGERTVPANRVIAYAPVNPLAATEADWPYFYHPDVALGAAGGTLDVASLGFDPAVADAPGGTLTLGLGSAADPAARACVVDGAGDDLAVYENAFTTTDPVSGLAGTENEVATLEVAEAAAGPWYGYPHALDATVHPVLPARYQGFAGVTPNSQGGDRFDLAVLLAAEGLAADFRACYVRLTDGGTRYPDYGNSQSDLWDSGADIDAVEALHSLDAPGLEP